MKPSVVAAMSVMIAYMWDGCLIAGFFSSSFYATIKLKTHGFSSSSIYDIAKATAVAKFFYASQSWWGLTFAFKREHLEKVIRRAKHLGYLEESSPTVSELANIADNVSIGLLALA